MARVEGFEPGKSEQQPEDADGNPVPVGVFGDSTTGVGSSERAALSLPT